ncbi:TlpA family protein disulfide reductase [Pedobacter rhodius]|uniref:TlpA disulfide reductase family protein n=1 Tax=Pedobacter rhodius TaxID=3004098 RepID=A0ABT4L0X1_9SPHI|nr:TlpA disulfide reductase family protein [Pedobacter sp. SJ11]MCZ4224835.1 TlpA disulfide reductase family protein [Pedobacter sp. SJ11]
MKLKLSFLLLLCSFFRVQSQVTTIQKTAPVLTRTGITVGQKVPDVIIQNITGLPAYDKSTALPLSAFKGKMLILDFWATWCAPCIAMNPKMEALQQQFDGRVQFLPVAYQSYQDVNTFYRKLEKQTGKYPALPMVTGDTILARLFPHQTLPHYVWIGGDGIVKAITDRQPITAENIEKLLAEGSLSLRVKQDEKKVYKSDEPLFFAGTDLGEGLFRSQLSGYVPGAGRGMYKDVEIQMNEPVRRITARNLTIPELFRLAYKKERKEMLLEVSDTAQLEPKKVASIDFLDWLKQGRGYCYELMVPEQLKNNAYTLMQDQLKSFFSDYHIGLEKRKVKCLALVRTSTTDKLHTAGGVPSAYLDGFGGKFKSCYLSVFLSRMQVPLQGNPLPLIDETGYKAMADLELTANMGNLDDVNKALARYDLRFVEKPADIEMLVIRNR